MQIVKNYQKYRYNYNIAIEVIQNAFKMVKEPWILSKITLNLLEFSKNQWKYKSYKRGVVEIMKNFINISIQILVLQKRTKNR